MNFNEKLRLRMLSMRAGAKWGLATAGLTTAALVYAAGIDSLGVFQLDRNAVDDGPGDDAEQVYCDHIDPTRIGACGASGSNTPASGITEQASVFVADKVNDSLDDGFTQGTKDSLDVSQWRWTLSPIGDKVDISNAFATLHKVGNDSILYLGLDKVANNGDAAIGFWILQNETAPIAPNVFSAPHKLGDVLIQADLTSGGRIGRYDVYTWGPNSLLNQPVADSQGLLTLAIHSTNCGAGADPDACGVVNAGGDVAPWPYDPKSGPSGKFPANSYFEGGLNLSKLFPNGIPCVSSFLAETRQSQSETASTADYALGNFNLCSFNIAKTGPAIAKVGDEVDYSITITNTGALPINKVSIKDSLKGDITNGGTGITSDCDATLEAGTACTITYSYTVPSNASAAVNFVNTVTAEYGVLEQTLIDDSTHEINLFKPAVTLDKKANGSDGPLTINQGDSLTYTILVTNTSTGDTPALECTVKDEQLGIEKAVTLDPGSSDQITQPVSSLTPGTVTNTATVSCTPTGYPNAVRKSDQVTVTIVKVDPEIAVLKTADAYSKTGDDVNYTITITNATTDQALTLTSINDPLLGGSLIGHSGSNCPVSPATLAAGAFCTINATRTTQANDPDPLVNTVTVVATNAFGNSTEPKSATASTDIVHPAYEVTKDCTSGEIHPGDSANFRIQVQNTGDVPLNVDIVDNQSGVNMPGVLLGTGPNCVFDNNAGDGCLEITASVIAQGTDVTNVVNTTATLPVQYGLPNQLDDSAGATCKVTEPSPPPGGATRTLGFWKSHGSDGDKFEPPVDFGYTCHVAEDHVLFPISLSQRPAPDVGKVLHNCSDLFGVFWSSPARLSNGATRPALCKTKLHASWQMLAAILNQGLDNGAPVPTDPVSGLSAIDALRNALGTSDRANIIRLQGILGGYNESGDDVAIVDDDGATIPNADPNGTRSGSISEPTNYAAGDCSW